MVIKCQLINVIYKYGVKKTMNYLKSLMVGAVTAQKEGIGNRVANEFLQDRHI